MPSILITDPDDGEVNSYVDIDFADTYFATTPRDGDWRALGTADAQEVALLDGMTVIEAFDYLGSRAELEQVLEFPRITRMHVMRGNSTVTDATPWTDRRGREWTNAEVPTPMKEAQCEFSLAVSLNPSLMDGIQDVKRIRTGVVTIEMGAGGEVSWRLAMNKIRPFLAMQSGNGRTARG